jgi:periplasmic protein TonB
MKKELKAFLASSFLHLLLLGSAASFAVLPLKQQIPILVDFTIEPDHPADTLATAGNPGVAPRRSVPAPRPSPSAPPLPVATAPETPPVTPAVHEEVISVEPEAVPVVAASSQSVPRTESLVASSGVVMVSSAAPAAGQGTGTANGSGMDVSGVGNGSRGESAEALRDRYLRKHFGYIRDLINGNLRYPCRARRMGWSGALKVEFTVREDGSVDGIRVIKSSGVNMLDYNAVETVRRSSPFPKPPVSARLIIPVEYILE